MAPQRSGTFEGFDLQDADDLKKMVVALRSWRDDHNRNRHSPEMRVLSTQQRSSLRVILNEMNSDDDARIAVQDLLTTNGDLVQVARALAPFARTPFSFAQPQRAQNQKDAREASYRRPDNHATLTPTNALVCCLSLPCQLT